MVAVAQLAESQIVDLVVTGSSPVGHPKIGDLATIFLVRTEYAEGHTVF